MALQVSSEENICRILENIDKYIDECEKLVAKYQMGAQILPFCCGCSAETNTVVRCVAVYGLLSGNDTVKR